MSGDGRRVGLGARIHPQDLERNGRSLVRAVGEQAGRSIGGGIWKRWREDDYHPTASELAAFLRGYCAPVGGWLPEGMAEYLADRLEKKHPKPKGGRTPPTAWERHQRWTREAREGRRIAEAVFIAWQRLEDSGAPYPQAAAIKEVSDRELLDEIDTKKTFSLHREGAVENMEAWLGGAAILSPEETELLQRIVSRERGPPNPEGLSAAP